VADDQARALPAGSPARGARRSDCVRTDVAPRPGGDNALTVIDWVQVGRFVAGPRHPRRRRVPTRDCAPMSEKGNGVLSIHRLGASRPLRLQAPVPSGGWRSRRPGGAQWRPRRRPGPRSWLGRAREFGPTSRSCLGISWPQPSSFKPWATKNALGFSVRFRSDQLIWVNAAKGVSAVSATLHVNTNDLAIRKLRCCRWLCRRPPP